MRSWSHESARLLRLREKLLSIRSRSKIDKEIFLIFDLNSISRLLKLQVEFDFGLSALIFDSRLIGSEFLSLLYSDMGRFFFFTSLNFDFSFSLTLYKTWNEDWKLIATMIYILYTWKISIIYIIIIFYLSLSQRYEAIYIEARSNFLSSESRSPHDRFDDSIRATASILSDTWYDSTFERLP